MLRDNVKAADLAQIAAHQHMSERTLPGKFRATGITVFEWIIRERIHRAKVLLETTDFIGEVAAMTGVRFDRLHRATSIRPWAPPSSGAYRRTARHRPAGAGRSGVIGPTA